MSGGGKSWRVLYATLPLAIVTTKRRGPKKFCNTVGQFAAIVASMDFETHLVPLVDEYTNRFDLSLLDVVLDPHRYEES